MPIGIVTDVVLVFLGTLLGGALRSIVPDRLREDLPKIFGICAFTIGITSVDGVQTLPIVIMSVILGFIIGELTRFYDRVHNGFSAVLKRLPFRMEGDHDAYMEQYLLAVLVFAMSGAGFFGALNEGMSGDPSILLSKSTLDMCTAVLFGALLGYAQALICIPQFLILMGCFLLAKVIAPWVTPTLLADFRACGGIVTMLTGLTVSRVMKLKAINLVPALAIVMPLVGLYHMIFG